MKHAREKLQNELNKAVLECDVEQISTHDFFFNQIFKDFNVVILTCQVRQFCFIVVVQNGAPITSIKYLIISTLLFKYDEHMSL